jgi:hypothetical protein
MTHPNNSHTQPVPDPASGQTTTREARRFARRFASCSSGRSGWSVPLPCNFRDGTDPASRGRKRRAAAHRQGAAAAMGGRQ